MLHVDIIKHLPHFTLQVAFSAAPSSLTAIVGPSGSGKTTLMRILAGLEHPDSGTITFEGSPWVNTARKIFIPPQQRNLGYVFQDHPLFPHLTLHKNITFTGCTPERAAVLLRDFGLDRLQHKRPGLISGGERQRGAICQALAGRPDLLLMDEPFSALDNETRRAIRGRLNTWRKKTDMPIIHVTHDLREALVPGTQVIPLVQGTRNDTWLVREQTILFEEVKHAPHLPPEHAFHLPSQSRPSTSWMTDISTILTNPARPSAPQHIKGNTPS
ncbi:MAG TPA: ATP-binding cassette domain-containing protein [Desulfomicrobiaceae bacterium]|nr:ATP-binding cassette domain-containing protein [Desulfomicrobiaceae bacterium]